MNIGAIEKLSESDELSAWEPERALPTFSLQEIRYGRGFLRADYTKLFSDLKEYWLPVISASGVAVQIDTIQPGFVFPASLDELVVVKINGEVALFGVDRRTHTQLAKIFSPGSEPLGAKIFIDYLARRFLFGLTKNLGGEVEYLGEADLGEVDIEGDIALHCIAGGLPITIHIGIGPELLQRVDQMARDMILADQKRIAPGKKQNLIIELGTFDQGFLAGNLEPGTWLGTELNVEAPVQIKLGEKVYIGKLGQFNGRFAVQTTNVSHHNVDADGAVSIEIARAEVPDEDIYLLSQQGAIFLTRAIVSTGGLLVRGGKVVSPIGLAKFGNKFAFRMEELG